MTPRGHSSPVEKTSGSPIHGEPEFLVVGKLGRPHGVRGELVMEVLTDFPERLTPGVDLYLGPHQLPFRLRSCRRYTHGLLVAFKGIESPEQAGQLRNFLVQVHAVDRPPLAEGEYYHHQLIGLQVIDETGKNLGTLDEILVTGANDVFVVHTPQGGEVLLPAIEEVIVQIDLSTKQITVHLLPGLISED